MLVALAALTIAAATPAPYIRYATAREGVTEYAGCPKYFGTTCTRWRLGGWLPYLCDDVGLPCDKAAAKTKVVDDFLGPALDGDVASRGATSPPPRSGTSFTYGNAGPPRGVAMYDHAHHIAYYRQGCCSWRTIVLAADAGPPPIPVQNSDLRAVHTKLGIALGDSPAHVESIYGRAALRPAVTTPGVMMLEYEHPFRWPCAQDQTFGFRDGRLVYIQLTNAC